MTRIILSLALTALLGTSGCIAVTTPAVGVLYTDVKWPHQVTDEGPSPKEATGIAHSFFGLFAAGDASVATIASKGSITKVHRVDVHTQNILGFGTLTVTVYGE